jgi:hypothetical protein
LLFSEGPVVKISAFAASLLLFCSLFARLAEAQTAASSTDFTTTIFILLVLAYVALAFLMVGRMIWKISKREEESLEPRRHDEANPMEQDDSRVE